MSLLLEHDFDLNPDGSGRVQVRWSALHHEGSPTPAEFLRSELEQAQGVAAWADARCDVEDDRIVFAATAWFDDVASLRFHCQGFHLALLDLAVVADDDGAVTVASQRTPADAFGAPALAADAPADVVRRTLAAERQKLAEARELVAQVFGAVSATAVLRLPADVADAGAGELVAPDAVRVAFSGAGIVDALDALLQRDELMLDLLRRGAAGPEAALALLGTQQPIAVRTTAGAAPRFDYAAEVAAARAAAADLPAFDATPAAAPLPTAELADARIVARLDVREADGAAGFTPAGRGEPGVTLTIAGTLPFPALALLGASATFADGGERAGEDLGAAADGRTVWFAVAGAVDGPITGAVDAECSEGDEVVDLGFPALTDDVEGTFPGARLLRFAGDEHGGALEVRLPLARSRVRAVQLVADGRTIELQPTGYMASGDECELAFEFVGRTPRKARVQLTFAGRVTQKRYVFTLAGS